MIQGSYFDGKTSKKHSCSVRYSNRSIYIYLSEEYSLIWDTQQIHSSDIQGEVLTIKYGDFPCQTLEVNSPDIIDFYHLINENNPVKQIKTHWLKNKRKSLVILLSSFLGLIFFSYFVVIPWIGEKATLIISKQTEIDLGESLSQNVMLVNSIDTDLSRKLNEFKDELIIDNSCPISIHVINSEMVNAFAIPGGNIFIYSGILSKMDNYEELAALLGHEITHVTHQHSLKSLGRSAASSIFISSLVGDIGGISSGIIEQANQLKQLTFSRELETEADIEGIQFLNRNKISARGMKNLLEILDKQTSDYPDLMEYISSHPDTKKRIKNSKKYSFEFPVNQTLDKVFQEIKEGL